MIIMFWLAVFAHIRDNAFFKIRTEHFLGITNYLWSSFFYSDWNPRFEPRSGAQDYLDDIQDEYDEIRTEYYEGLVDKKSRRAAACGRAELLAKRHVYWASTVVFSNWRWFFRCSRRWFFQDLGGEAAFWKNPEKIWSNFAKIQQNSGKICEFLGEKNSKNFSNF